MYTTQLVKCSMSIYSFVVATAIFIIVVAWYAKTCRLLFSLYVFVCMFVGHAVNEISEVWQQLYTPWAVKRSQLIFVRNFVKNQRILMQSSLIDLEMNDTCDSMNFTHLT